MCPFSRSIRETTFEPKGTELTDQPPESQEPQIEHPPVEVVESDPGDEGEGRRPEDEAGHKVDETVDHPAKVMRIGAMLKQLLEELRSTELDEPSRERLRDIYDTSVSELGSALSTDLREELGRLALPFSGDDTPSTSELQIAKAQLVGWLEGLVQGMQAMLFAQQMSAQQQLQSIRGELGPGGRDESVDPTPPDERPGTYL